MSDINCDLDRVDPRAPGCPAEHGESCEKCPDPCIYPPEVVADCAERDREAQHATP